VSSTRKISTPVRTVCVEISCRLGSGDGSDFKSKGYRCRSSPRALSHEILTYFIHAKDWYGEPTRELERKESSDIPPDNASVPALSAERRHGIESKPRGQSSTIAPPSIAPSPTLIQHRHGRHTGLVLQNEEESQAPTRTNKEKIYTGRNGGQPRWGGSRLDEFASATRISRCSGRKLRRRRG